MDKVTARSVDAVLTCLRDSATLFTLPAWCRGELSTAADLIDQLRQQLAAALAERDRAVKDAARYRWLRREANQNTAHDIYGNGGYWRIGLHSSDNRLTLDTAIDAAIQEQTNGRE